MKQNKTLLILILILLIPMFNQNINAQSNESASIDKTEQAFAKANELAKQKKFGEALVSYQEALKQFPDNTTLLFNAGLMAYHNKDYAKALNFWKHLKEVDPKDWQARAKLVQTYQALGSIAERDKERADLFDLRKKGSIESLNKQLKYCREQFQVGGENVMVFEFFELQGDQALKYVFNILNPIDEKEKYRISLGSYKDTNQIWHEVTKPSPPESQRLYHLDGYFPNEHNTYGMYSSEPSYESVRKSVIEILGNKKNPVSSTTN